MSDPLITSAELLAAWPGLASLPTDEQAALVLAATAAVEGYVGRPLGRGEVVEAHRPGSTRMIYLEVTPVASVTSIVSGWAGSAVTLVAGDYEVDPATGAVELYRDYGQGYRYPDRTYGVDPRSTNLTVTYQGGWTTAAVPADVKRATIIAAKALSQGTSAGIFASEQLAGYSYRVAGSAGDGGASSGSGLPATAVGLLRRLKRVRLA